MLYATLATVALGAFTPARPAIRQFSLAKAPQPLRVSPLGMCASEEADADAGEPPKRRSQFPPSPAVP